MQCRSGGPLSGPPATGFASSNAKAFLCRGVLLASAQQQARSPTLKTTPRLRAVHPVHAKQQSAARLRVCSASLRRSAGSSADGQSMVARASAHGFYMEVLCSGGLVRGGHAADISRHGALQPMPTHPPTTQALPHLRRKATYLATLTRSSSFNRASQPCRSHSNKGPCIVSHASGVTTFTGTCGALTHPSLIRLTRARC